MKPVMQDLTRKPPISSFRACVATILEIDIDDIPVFETRPGFFNGNTADWFSTYKRFLEKRGLRPFRANGALSHAPLGYSILSDHQHGYSGAGHCVVVLDGKIVHDPAGGDLTPPKFSTWIFDVFFDPWCDFATMFPVETLDPKAPDNVLLRDRLTVSAARESHERKLALEAEKFGAAENDALFKAELNKLRAKKMEKGE